MSGPSRFARHPLCSKALAFSLLSALTWGCGSEAGTDPNEPPTPAIAAPSNGATFGIGQEVQFQGSATDPEDGTLTGGSLVWTSSLDGQLGTGASVARSDLSEGAHEITLTGTDSDGADATASVMITVANQPPAAPTITDPADGALFSPGDEIEFTGTATDPEDGELGGASLTWSSDLDGEMGTGGSIFRDDLSEGTHQITLTATDSHGESASSSIEITIQNQPPTAAITEPADGATFGIGTTVDFEGAATDPEEGALTGGSLVWTSDVDGQIGTGRTFSRSDLAPGDHMITLTATDSQNESGSASVTITIENVPPTPAITAPADGAVLEAGSPVTFQGSATDAEDGALTGASLVWTSDLDGQIGTGTSVTTSALSTGDHVITLTATDSHGASASTSIDVSVRSAPAATIDAPADGTTVTSGDPVTFEGSATDAEDGALTGSSLVWTSDLDGEIGTGETFTRDDLSVGDHTITLTATDSDGLTGSASIELTVQSGDQDPTVSITQPADGASFEAGTSVTFQATASDPQDGNLTGGSVVWTSDVDGQIGTGTSFSTSTLSSGTHTVTVTATDSDDRTASDAVTIEILDPPTATITAPAGGSNFEEGTDVTFEGNATDPDDGPLTGASLVWTSNMDGQIGTGESFTTSTLSRGTHTVTLTATDSDGLTGTDQITVTIDPPGSPPTATITNPTDGASFDQGVSITFEGSGSDPDDGALTGASLVWTSSIDGQIGTGGSFSRSDLSVGTHTITLTATDSDDRTGTDQISVTVTGDPILVKVGNDASSSLSVGAQTTLPVIVDMSNAGGRNVASIQVRVTWSTAVATYVGGSATSTQSGVTINDNDGATGELVVNMFVSTGELDTFTLFEFDLEGASAGSTTVDVAVEVIGNEAGDDLSADTGTRDHDLTVN